MIKLISHRGNLNGKNPERENHPDYIMEAINQGYHVEVDIRSKDGKLYYGHDHPRHEVKGNLLRFQRIICHAKDKEAFRLMLEDGEIHCFWHDKDDYTITSRGLVWVHPTKELLPNSVCVLPEFLCSTRKFNSGNFKGITGCYAICSDRIAELVEGSIPETLKKWTDE